MSTAGHAGTRAVKMARLAYLRLGGAVPAHVHEIIAGLERRGWTVELFEPREPADDRRPGLFQRAGTFIGVQTRMWRRLRDVDAIYIRNHPAALLSVLWARWKHVPVVQEVNGRYTDFNIALKMPRSVWALVLWVIRQGIRRSNAVIAVTEQLREVVLSEKDNANVYVIPNAANPDIFHPSARTDIPVPKPYVTWFGFMGGWQGVDTLLTAVHCPAWPAEVHLVIIGYGPESTRVEEAARASDRIVYVGRQEQPQIAGLVAGSLAGLSPQNDLGGRSSSGGLAPLKVFETLACGVPVIVTDFPGQRELVRAGGCGLVIRPDSPEDLAQAVADISRDAACRQEMGRRGRQLVVEEHSWDRRAADTDVVLRDLIRRPVCRIT